VGDLVDRHGLHHGLHTDLGVIDEHHHLLGGRDQRAVEARDQSLRGRQTAFEFWQIILPLTRPALAALGTLEFIWIYNDFFWPLLLIQNVDRLPVTTGINNLKGAFVENDNLIAAGAIMTVIPTLIVYLVLQRQFVAGLTLGSTKG